MGKKSAWRCRVFLAATIGIVSTVASAAFAQPASRGGAPDNLVAVAVVDGGRAIVLATPGAQTAGRSWRFRSFDTGDLPQPFQDVSLSSSGTKLFVQSASGAAQIIDLLRRARVDAPLQWVDPKAVATDGQARKASHRLPDQRFVSVTNGTAQVVDDTGAPLEEFAPHRAIHGAITRDGVSLYVRPDGVAVMCGEPRGDPSRCRELPAKLEGGPMAIASRASATTPMLGDDNGGNGGTAASGLLTPRFLLLTGDINQTRIVNPEVAGESRAPSSRIEAALRAYLELHELSLSASETSRLVGSLQQEISDTQAADRYAITDWRFFHVSPDEALYMPVLEFAEREMVFPSRFDMLEKLGGRPNSSGHDLHAESNRLLDRYLRLSVSERRAQCTMYFRTHSMPGIWLIEYWIYYPFDVGGLGSHLHDPEHFFVEVDKLGGSVRRVIGAAHGYMAGNNIYSTDRRGAMPIDLPLFAIVELGKHATATDLDRNGVFIPGLDENEYRERAKIWGVRDVMGTINNQLGSYERTMSADRRLEHYAAPVGIAVRFPDEPGLADRACCRLEPMPAGDSSLSACADATTDCARRSVISHPDFRDRQTVLKEWVFPHAFLRATYGLGPRQRLHSVAIGYALDLDRVPGLRRVMPMPGRVGGEIIVWRQDITVPDAETCLAGCNRDWGVGVGVRYEQFLSNLFGIYSAVRVYSLAVEDIYVTFGPMVEVPLFNRSNVNFQVGLSFRPYGSPRFEMKVSTGLWKLRSNRFGLPARRGDGS